MISKIVQFVAAHSRTILLRGQLAGLCNYCLLNRVNPYCRAHDHRRNDHRPVAKPYIRSDQSLHHRISQGLMSVEPGPRDIHGCECQQRRNS